MSSMLKASVELRQMNRQRAQRAWLVEMIAESFPDKRAKPQKVEAA